jgi:uncharacterized protein involved in type VI secretion and phage assembly
MSTLDGVIVARVKGVVDDQGEGRVQIEYPWMEGNEDECPLVPMATLMSGGGRGSWFMPEEGDEVLVAFDNGDVNFPYILGCLWNGVDKPPTDDGINEKVRRIQTTSGHRIDLDDNTGQEKIVIRTQGGSTVEMKDTPVDKVTSVSVTTAGEHKVELDDKPLDSKVTVSTSKGNEVTLRDPGPQAVASGAIQLKTAAGNQVVLKDAPGGVEISCPTGLFTLTCMQATLNVTSGLLVNAPTTIFSGVVIAQALTTTSVISPTYTPGVGNTYGL